MKSLITLLFLLTCLNTGYSQIIHPVKTVKKEHCIKWKKVERIHNIAFIVLIVSFFEPIINKKDD